MAITEKVSLLGAGLYKDIPDTLTLKNIPTACELDYVGSEDFDATMLDKILPRAVEEKINFRKLLEIDYNWICRCLRMLNYGPYHTVGSLYCEHCGLIKGDYQINLMTSECKPLPSGFENDIVIPKGTFMDFKGEVHLRLLTIQAALNASEDKAFQDMGGTSNTSAARLCYMISQIGDRKGLTPFEIKMKIESEFSAADYAILKATVTELADYGLRAGGTTQCPKCGRYEASYLALVNDRYFRPTLADLRKWRDDRDSGTEKNVHGTKAADV